MFLNGAASRSTISAVMAKTSEQCSVSFTTTLDQSIRAFQSKQIRSLFVMKMPMNSFCGDDEPAISSDSCVAVTALAADLMRRDVPRRAQQAALPGGAGRGLPVG